LTNPKTSRRSPSWLSKLLIFAALSLAVHLVLFGVVVSVILPLWPRPSVPADSSPVSVSVLDGPLVVDPWSTAARLPDVETDQVEAEEPKEPEKPPVVVMPSGQIVETPPPFEEKIPKDAQYLAEHNNDVEVETRSERFKINPEILASTYSDEAKLQLEDAVDLGFREPSTGAKAGNPSPDLDRAGRFSPVTSPFAVTNKEGLQKPVPASHSTQDLAGAPSNDWLNEKDGPGVNLRTREYLFAGYINRIRRLVNYYWQQNLDNLSPTVRLTKSHYETVVDVVLTAEGALESCSVTDASGSQPLDAAVIEAFRIAGPFPHPPEQLIDGDGRARLPDFGFVVQIGQAKAQFMGIDPRSDVQFPGILKSPR
jgi:TonB family protein